MSIEDAGKVDIIARKGETNTVVLVISDHWPWDDVQGHLHAIQEKLNSYIAFIETRQLWAVREPKIPENPEIEISLVLKYEPPPGAVSVLGQMKIFLADNLGVALGWKCQ